MSRDFSNFTKSLTPQLNYLKTQPKPLKYEESIFKRQAEDIKSTFELQLEALKKSNETLEAQLQLAKDSAAQAEQNAGLARAESRTSRHIAIISMVVAFVSPLLTLLVEHLIL